MADAFVEFWQPSHWRREYGYYDPKVYTKGYHRAQDIAGGDWGNRSVPALRAGRVVDTGFGVAIGYWVAVQVSRNRVDGYCHLYGPGRPAKGTDLGRGDSVSRLAHRNESPGSAWSGEHLHFIVTDSASGVPNASAWDTDPRPIIQAELASVAGGTARPFEPPIIIPEPEEDDMSWKLIPIDGNIHIQSQTTGLVKHVADSGDLDRLIRIRNTKNDSVESILKSTFIEADIPRLTPLFAAINPPPQVDHRLLAAEIVELLPDGSTLTAEEIADEFDRRARERLNATIRAAT